MDWQEFRLVRNIVQLVRSFAWRFGFLLSTRARGVEKNKESRGGDEDIEEQGRRGVQGSRKQDGRYVQ